MGSEFYKLKSEVLKALAHPIRLKILELVAEKEELCVCEIHEEINVEQSNVSRHLAVLRQVGVLDNRREGIKAMYSLREPLIKDILEIIDKVVINQFEAKKAVEKEIYKEN